MGVAESRNDRFYQLCGLGKAHLVERMLEADKDLKTININWQNYEIKCTPLLTACANGHDKVIEILLKHGADVKMRDERGCSVLHHAAQSGHSNIVKMLIEAGCDLNAIDKNHWTPLMNACYWANEEAALVLMEAGADLNLKNIDGRTALHEVCRSPATVHEDVLARIADSLIRAGAVIDHHHDHSHSANGETKRHEDLLNPLMYAAYHNHVGVANVLIGYNCDLDITDYRGWSALHWSADRDHIEIVKLLLERGCKINLQGKRDESALDRAKSDTVRDILTKHSSFESASSLSLNSYHKHESSAFLMTNDSVRDIIAKHSGAMDCFHNHVESAAINAS